MPNGFNSLSPMAARRPLGSMNALASTQGKPAAAPNPNFSVEQHVQQNYEQAKAQHTQLMQSAKRINAVRKELDSLGKLGDQVTVEDVVKGAGTLVGTGFSPMALAQMLSSMPTTGGQALQAWVAQQDQQVQGMEAQMRQKLVDSAVHKGGSAMAALHVQTIKGNHQMAQAGAGGQSPPAPAMGQPPAPPTQAPPGSPEESETQE